MLRVPVGVCVAGCVGEGGQHVVVDIVAVTGSCPVSSLSASLVFLCSGFSYP